jgi:hypothetical protein
MLQGRGSAKETEMLMVMDMSTGKIIEDEFGKFEDEVLNAEWTPASPELQLGCRKSSIARRPPGTSMPMPSWPRCTSTSSERHARELRLLLSSRASPNRSAR